jgi:hypothetical protein
MFPEAAGDVGPRSRATIVSSPPPIGTSVHKLFEARKISAPQAIKEMVNTRRQARRRETQALMKSLRAEWRDEGK